MSTNARLDLLELKIIMINEQIDKILKLLEKIADDSDSDSDSNSKPEPEPEPEPEPKLKPYSCWADEPNDCGNCGESSQYCSGCG
jgi:hypothetical protein